MSSSALEGGAVFEGEGQASVSVGRGVIQQPAPELFAEGGDFAVLPFQDSEEVRSAVQPHPFISLNFWLGCIEYEVLVVFIEPPDNSCRECP